MTVLATPCPSCGDVLDDATNVSGNLPPKDGDVCVCFRCGHVMVFEGGRPRSPTSDEMHYIAGDPRLLKLQKALASIRKDRTAMPVSENARRAAVVAFGPVAGKRLDAGLCPRCGRIPKQFRDQVSEREAHITGLCQDCQDVVFAEPEDDGE